MVSTRPLIGAGPFQLPPGFRFGVSDAGFQSEGGYNGPGQPENNWAAWEQAGVGRAAGSANEFWTRYDEHFERAASIGCDSYRMSIEWARCEPKQGQIDTEALEHYARILRSCRDHGLEPVVTLQHFTQPAWLGPDFWLDPAAPDRLAEWVELALSYLAPLCSRWVTVNEINANAIGSFFVGYFPPGHKLRAGSMGRSMDVMLRAHIKAYETIHRLQPEAKVGTSLYLFSNYDVDVLLLDILRCRSLGVERRDVAGWLDARRAEFHQRVKLGLSASHLARQSAMNVGVRALFQLHKAFDKSLDAVYASEFDKCLDVNQVSFYDPNLSNYLRMPGRHSTGLRTAKRVWRPDPEHWEQLPSPQQVAPYLLARTEPAEEVWMVENGMCNSATDGVPKPRADATDRPTYLREHIAGVVGAVQAGVNVTQYFHWTLFDNYQWGGHASCFGLYGVDREKGNKFLDTDSMGYDSGGAYRSIIEGLRANDTSVLQVPYTPTRAETDDTDWPSASEAAFFDLDKTVISKPAMVAFGKPLYQAGLISRWLVARSLMTNLRFHYFGADHERVSKLRAMAMDITRGWDSSVVSDIVNASLDQFIRPTVFNQAIELIREHQRAGRRVFLVSASPTEIVEPIGRLLGVDEVIASRCTLDTSGCYTGDVEFWSYGEAKAEAMREVAARDDLDLNGSYAYTDSATDLPMLEAVGNPVAVNPDRALELAALERGWKISRFGAVAGPAPRSHLRPV